MKFFSAVLLSFFLSCSALAYDLYPGRGKTVTSVRPQWDTGYFQEALIRRALTELGYTCEQPKVMPNAAMYESVMNGSADYMADGWFPDHESQLPRGYYDKAENVGYVLKRGGIQGYMIPKKYADKYHITSLEDFRRPDVRKAFDIDGDGRADLSVCPKGWMCREITEFHLKEYNLGGFINLADSPKDINYEEILDRYTAGRAVLFYNWAPNWTNSKMIPGMDAVWINVPFTAPYKSQSGSQDRLEAVNIAGAVTEKIRLGFAVSDIRVTANSRFLKKNPAVRKFFEVFSLSLDNISEQNSKMHYGEKSEKDIERHVTEWIAGHKSKWDRWLADARQAAD
ncbi:MAG: glycine betaine/L-proline ABC transporter substrate-binding protein ProX [Deferribacterales bacterium]